MKKILVCVDCADLREIKYKGQLIEIKHLCDKSGICYDCLKHTFKMCSFEFLVR